LLFVDGKTGVTDLKHLDEKFKKQEDSPKHLRM
jgi:hypothetical protein